MVAGALDGAEAEEGRRPSLTGRLSLRLKTAALAQEGRGFLWWPIALTLGVWAYFALPAEPALTMVAALAGLGLVLFWLGRTSPVLVILGTVALGFVLAKARAEWVGAPLLQSTTGEVKVTGRVVSVDDAARRRLTIILDVEAIDGLAPEQTPRRLRLSSLAKLGEPMIGHRIAATARLQPLPTPVAPGAFDYGRALWLDGVGGTGRIVKPIEEIEATASWTAIVDAILRDIRKAVGSRIRAVLGPPVDAFADALITGERASIPAEVNQSLLASGLFHILSISGLHMWMVVGGVFWTIRAALALVPALALRYPIKKWAAALALAMGYFYLLLADSGVATQRSFIMIAVVFFAMLVDRPALSTRNLAIAAMIVLVLEPEAAIEAGFQMSFLAVLGLVAFYETWGRWNRAQDQDRAEARHPVHRLASRLGQGLLLSVVTTLVAGTMSSIPAAYHFGRMAPYSLVANTLALPVVGILVMPFALLSAVLMPLGLEAAPLWVMGEGLRLVMAISDWVAGFSGAKLVLAQPAPWKTVIMVAGAVVLCMVQGGLRLLGLPVIALGLALMAVPEHGPDVIVERAGQNVVIRNGEGLLVPALARRSRFSVEKWLAADGDEATPAEAAARSGWTCTKTRCDAIVGGKRLAFLMAGEGETLSCEGLDIVIASFPLRRACRNVGLRIDRFDLWRQGSHAITFRDGAVAVSTARGEQGRRPWVVEPRPRATPWRGPSAANRTD